MVSYVKHYIWFWKESFSFMKGSPKTEIVKGCLKMAHPFAKDMVKWDKMSKEQRENWYIHADRTL